MREISVSAPGRVCLFGEDVDYMNLEVITLAVDRRITVNGRITDNGKISINLKDFNKELEFNNELQEIKSKRDYIASSFNLYHSFLNKNFGAEIEVSSNIPIGKGLSSSSAFCSALVAFFDKAAKLNSSKKELALKAYSSEVVNLGEAGGMMDHFASIFGDVLYLECRDPYFSEKLKVDFSGLVIGDTLEKKETVETIRKRKYEIKQGIEEMKEINRSFKLINFPLKEIQEVYKKNPNEGLKRLIGICGIRDVVRTGYHLMKQGRIQEDKFSELINNHHTFQQEYFENVTRKMENLIVKSKEAGALGCKLLGSGNGGSFLAYAPGKVKEVIESISKGGGEAYLVCQDKGLKYS
jgi:galactokinase